MRSLSPLALLLLLLSAALAILLAGNRLAWREVQVHLPRDRQLLESVTCEMEDELSRLVRLYEKKLHQLARATVLLAQDRPAVWRECDAAGAITQWSLLHSSDPTKNIHLTVDLNVSDPPPEPTLVEGKSNSAAEQVLLSVGDLFNPGGETWGWIHSPDKPLIFWQRVNDKTVVVLLINADAVRASLDPLMGRRILNIFGPLQGADAPPISLESAGTILAATATPPVGAPDWLLPLNSPLGVWKLFAWDRVETQVRYNLPTLTVAGMISTLVALLGVVGFIQQRSMLARTAQRVTFVNRVSHELRTPLTNILLNLDLLADTMDDSAPDQVRRFSLIQEEARRLGRLIENVLTFSRTEHGRLKFEPQRSVPDEIIQSVVQQFNASFERRQLTVRHAANASRHCLLDRDAFAQILSNLLSNIEKYVPGGNVDISSRFDGDIIVLTITDEGPGIAAADAARIFQPFERLNGRVNEGVSGTGLGLTIARELAEGMGGSLRLAPSERGASFELHLPTLPPPNLDRICAP